MICIYCLQGGFYFLWVIVYLDLWCTQEYKERRNFVCEMLAEAGFANFSIPQGSFFVFAELPLKCPRNDVSEPISTCMLLPILRTECGISSQIRVLIAQLHMSLFPGMSWSPSSTIPRSSRSGCNLQPSSLCSYVKQTHAMSIEAGIVLSKCFRYSVRKNSTLSFILCLWKGLVILVVWTLAWLGVQRYQDFTIFFLGSSLHFSLISDNPG